MGVLYKAIPFTSHDVTEVATSAVLKTLLQVATPSTTDIRIHGWGVSFDGVAAADPPGKVELIDTNVAATVTTLTPVKWESNFAQNSLCVGGVSATGFNASAEGSITASRLLDGENVHPQTGYGIWFPEGRRPGVAVSRFLRVRATFSVSVNAIPWIVFEEPA
jgi:hypothetical protein